MTSTGHSVLFHVGRSEAVVSYAALGQTQAECLKIDLFSSFFFFFLPLWCYTDGIPFCTRAMCACKWCSGCHSYIILLRHWATKQAFPQQKHNHVCSVMLSFGDKHGGIFILQKRHNQPCIPESIFNTVCVPLCKRCYVTSWWGNTSRTSPPLHNQPLSGG